MNDKNLIPIRTREQAKLFGRIGGSRKTVKKQRALLIINMRKRKCVNCSYLDCCYVAQSTLGHKNNIKNFEKTGDLIPTLEAKCQLPLWMLNALSYLVASEDLHELEKFFFSRMLLSLDNFEKQFRFSSLLFKSLLKNRVNIDLIKAQHEVVTDSKIEVVIVNENKDNEIDKTTIRE